MTKFILAFIALMLVADVAISQNAYGLKAGVNFSNQKVISTPSNSLSNKALIGYQIGLFYKRNLNSKWNLVTEGNFSLIGANYEYIFINNTNPDHIATDSRYYANRIGYLEVPILIQMNISKFYFGAGPGISLKLFNTKSDTHQVPTYTRFDFAGNIMAGFKIAQKLDLNARYSHGIANTLKDQSFYGEYKHVAIKNRSASLCILYHLN